MVLRKNKKSKKKVWKKNLIKEEQEIFKLKEKEQKEKKKTKKSKTIQESKETSLNSVILAILTRQLEQKTLDFQIKSTDGLNSAFLMGAYTFEDSPIDYAVLFSYLGGKAKENPYTNYFEQKRKEREEKEKKETEAKELSYEKITKFVKSRRLKEVTNVEGYEATPFLKEKYEYFKIFNQSYSFLLYQMLR